MSSLETHEMVASGQIKMILLDSLLLSYYYIGLGFIFSDQANHPMAV